MLAFLVSFVGHVIVLRQFRIFISEFALSLRWIEWFHLFLGLCSVGLVIYFRNHPIVPWLFFGIFWGTLKFFAYFLKQHIEVRMEEAFPILLDGVLVGLSSGMSLRQAMSMAIQCEQGWLKNSWQKILNNLDLIDECSQPEIRSGKGFYDDLVPIFKSNSKQKDQIVSLRRIYQIKIDFRRRSGQILTHLKWQAGILSLLYFLLLVFVVTNFGYSKHASSIGISLVLFFSGIGVVYLIRRKQKWNL